MTDEQEVVPTVDAAGTVFWGIEDRIQPRGRRTSVHFADDNVKSMNTTIRASLDDLLKAQGDISYVQGVKGAVEAIAQLLTHCSVRLNDWPQEYLEPWLAHITATKAACGCDISTDYDGGHDIDFCKDYKDKDYRRLWYLGYFGLTEEELIEREREEQRQKAEAAARREAEHKAERLKRFHQLAREFNVDPKYLP